jgi:hypothetical protein
MTAIEGVGRPTTIRSGSRTAASAAGGFALPSEAAPASLAPAAATPAAALGSMLTLQELGSETVEDREARKHGQTLLALLTELQRSLLSGADNATALSHLAELAAAVPRATDRRLAAMVSAIIVRVRVELARREL